MERNRRQFCQLAALGGGAALLNVVFPGRLFGATTDALLLSCMDYRLVDATERYMAKRGMRNKYDHVVLAGAALGAITDQYPDWNKTFWEHLDIAIQLHQIHQVIVMDHRDCGAFKAILGEDLAPNPAKEKDVHATQLKALGGAVRKKYPKMDVELLLMSLDGKVESISA